MVDLSSSQNVSSPEGTPTNAGVRAAHLCWHPLFSGDENPALDRWNGHAISVQVQINMAGSAASIPKNCFPLRANTKSGWWFQPTPLKNDGVRVSWDDVSFPTVSGQSEKNSMVPVTTNQLFIFHIFHNQRVNHHKKSPWTYPPMKPPSRFVFSLVFPTTIQLSMESPPVQLTPTRHSGLCSAR